MEENRQFNMPVLVGMNQQQVQTLRYGIENTQYHFRDYINIIIKRKWLVLGVFLGVVLITALITFLMTPVYRSSVMLQIIQDNSSSIIGERDPFAMLSGQDAQSRFYETQYMILSSRPILYKIIDSLNLKNSQEFKVLQDRYPKKSPQEIESIFADNLLKKLEIKPLKRSYLVEIAFKSTDRDLAMQVPNAIYKEYLRFGMQTRQQSYTLIKEWLEGELQQLGNKVVLSEKKLYEHGQKKDFLSLEGKENVITRKYIELSALLTKAQSERVSREALYRQIKDKGSNASPITNNVLIQKLREQVIRQEANVASINKIYDQNYPPLQAEQAKLNDLRSRINSELQRVRTSIEADYEAALRTENLLREALEHQKSQVAGLQGNLVQHHILKRDMLTNEQLYQALLARMKEASVASTMVSSNVAVITPAEFPFKPYRPQVALNLIVGSLIGLIGGIGLAFLVEHLDDSIKTVEELERVCSISSLGMVPLLSKDKRIIGPVEPSLAFFSQPASLFSEAIRQVRTSIMLSSSGGPPAALMITSANPDEGKTTTAINIAISLTLNGRKVVLIDCDLRKPSIHAAFNQAAVPGLSDFLSGNAVFSDIIRPTEIPNLEIIAAGTIPPNPTDLLASKSFSDLLDTLRQDFQHLMLDTPPVLGFADGQALSPLVDGVLLVVKQFSTTRQAALLAKQLLQQVNARIIGSIMNMATTSRSGYGTYYGYQKYYSQYYKNDQKKIDA